MATAFMRWLETRPADYDRGIQILTLGKLEPLQRQMVDEYIQEDWDVLEIGCGTGALTVMLAESGANVTAIDRSKPMLEQARIRIQDHESLSEIELVHMDATGIADRFEPAIFDAVVSSLAFSEMSVQQQQFVLAAARRLLRPTGVLLVLDEFKPSGPVPQLISTLARLPLRLVTWLLTRTSSSALNGFKERLTGNGFNPVHTKEILGGALQVVCAELDTTLKIPDLSVPGMGRLHGHWTLQKVALEAWTLFFRILPPYPQKESGLYEVGHPGPDSPVLVTGNYLLTVQRLVRAIDGHIDAWLLVVDSDGINVWCGAGGGFLTAERVLSAWRLSALGQRVAHQKLILPELCANGVDGWKIRKQSGWEVHWGPVKAKDIPAYLQSGMKKNDAMRLVSFPLLDRLEMMAATLGFYALMILVPIAIFWPSLLGLTTFSLLALSTFYAVTLYWLPGRDGLQKGAPLAGIALLGLLVFTSFGDPIPVQQLFRRAVGLTGLSVFIGAELQGMSPQMRGEQANWGWEVLIAIFLGLVYWLVPQIVGWR
ncbi:MAG: methyltransferase domain-containing protein [Anaerolineales bacterium]|jgi:ubiquinone/menaquinone biosynthesis C-methylase UbiE